MATPSFATVCSVPTRTRMTGSAWMSATGMPRFGGGGGRAGAAAGAPPGRSGRAEAGATRRTGVASATAGQAVGEAGPEPWAWQPLLPTPTKAARRSGIRRRVTVRQEGMAAVSQPRRRRAIRGGAKPPAAGVEEVLNRDGGRSASGPRAINPPLHSADEH